MTPGGRSLCVRALCSASTLTERSEIRGAVSHSQLLVGWRGWRGKCEWVSVWERERCEEREEGKWSDGGGGELHKTVCKKRGREREREREVDSLILLRGVNLYINYFIHSSQVLTLCLHPSWSSVWLTAWRVTGRGGEAGGSLCLQLNCAIYWKDDPPACSWSGSGSDWSIADWLNCSWAPVVPCASVHLCQIAKPKA